MIVLHYVVFDTETTGLNVNEDDIIEISGVKIDTEGNVVDEFHEIVFRSVKLSKKITELTGITNEELFDEGKPPQDVFERFQTFLGEPTETVLVGHNIEFDLNFLYKEIGMRNYSFYDTLTMSRVFLPWLKNYKLDTVCKEFGVALDQHHRSLYDSRATGEIFNFLLNMMKVRNYPSLINTLSGFDQDKVNYATNFITVPNDLPKNFYVASKRA